MLKVQIKHNSWRKIELKAGGAERQQRKQQRAATPSHPDPRTKPHCRSLSPPNFPNPEPKTQLNPRHFHNTHKQDTQENPERKTEACFRAISWPSKRVSLPKIPELRDWINSDSLILRHTLAPLSPECSVVVLACAGAAILSGNWKNIQRAESKPQLVLRTMLKGLDVNSYHILMALLALPQCQ